MPRNHQTSDFGNLRLLEKSDVLVKSWSRFWINLQKTVVKFGFGDYGRVRRAAFVGDQKWLELFTRFVGPFTHAEEMHFLTDQLEAAVNWANA